MKTKYYRYHFVIIKLVGLLMFMGWQLVAIREGLTQKCIHFLGMSLFLLMAIMIELTQDRKQKTGYLIGEGILSIAGVFLFPVTGFLSLAITVLDGISLLYPGVWGYFAIYVLLIVAYETPINMPTAFGVLSILFIFYIQEKVVVEKYRKIIQENERTEGHLKNTMESSSRRFKEEISRSHLRFENQMLEERGRITQALHDKLGHSINGSLYKLEAAKLLVEKKPEECQENLQEVIDNLRGSMDEIRMILRRERPDKKRMAVLSLQSFCEECEEKYHIGMDLNLGKDYENIPENIWEIIIDNTMEAVTNALKYSECTNIFIHIVPMNAMVRCSVKDDGKGAAKVEEGMGLAGMRRRVRSVKGFFDVETEVGMGFSINMLLPFGEEGDKQE